MKKLLTTAFLTFFATHFFAATYCTYNSYENPSAGTLIIWVNSNTSSGEGVMAQIRYSDGGGGFIYPGWISGTYDNTNGPTDTNYKIEVSYPTAETSVEIEVANCDPYGSITPASSANYSGFINTASGLLPVEYVFFHTEKIEAGVALHWQTATEQNNSHFNIQRSADSKTWKTLGTVQGHGTTLETQDYTFTDRQPLNGRNYYRLEQVGYDGGTEFSKIVSVGFRKDDNTVSFSPNPVSDEMNFQFSEDMEGDYMVTIYDLNGKIWQSENVRENKLNVSGLAAGVYFLKIENETGRLIAQERFVKK